MTRTEVTSREQSLRSEVTLPVEVLTFDGFDEETNVGLHFFTI